MLGELETASVIMQIAGMLTSNKKSAVDDWLQPPHVAWIWTTLTEWQNSLCMANIIM